MPNLRLAARTLVRSPFVTLVAVASLALGIGANTAIYSLIRGVLLRPLPVPEPEQLVTVLAEGPNPGSQMCNAAGNCSVIFTYPMFKDLEGQQSVLSGLAGFRIIGADLAFQGKSLSGDGLAVSGSYFGVLGLRPALGRLLGPDDDRAVGGAPVAVLSHRYWTRELGADPAVLNQSLLVNGRTFTIVGVAPPGFDGITLGSRPRVFVPLTMMPQVSFLDESAMTDRQRYWVYLMGRLKSHSTIEAAAAGLNAVYHPIITDVEVPLQAAMPDEMMARFKAKSVRVESAVSGRSNLQRESRTPLLLLIGVTAIVLLVACTNVANLLLARAAGRQGEMAVRSSLGAQRGQLIGQLMLESAIVAVAAGGLSLLVAHGTLRLLLAFLPQEISSTVDIVIDLPVLLFAGGLSLGTVFVFGLVPALQSTRPDLLATIQASGGRGSAGRGAARFRSGLVTAQIALSTALLCSAGLFVRSLLNVSRVDLGIRTDSVVTFAISPVQMGYPAAQREALFLRVEEALRAIPGVTAVTSATVPILVGWSNGGDVDVEGFKATLESDVNTRQNQVGPGYFSALGIPVLQGREFLESDGVGGSRVAVVNEEFVRMFGLGTEAIGKRVTEGNPLTSRRPAAERPSYQIVGVVRNSAYDRVKASEPQPLFFSAHRQDSTTGRLVYYVRTSIAPETIIRAIPPLVAGVDPSLPVSGLTTLPTQVRENVYLDRMITTVSAAFAVLATLLAAVGLYGVLAYSVTLRTREIGVRMALGADAGNISALVMRQVTVMAIVGGLLGVASALGIGRVAGSLLFGLSAADPVAFAAAILSLAGVALAAGYLPARRAARVHPTQALRGE
ncbi:MAG: ABC transporter permease [Gemmatimonadales bacterium]